MLKVSKAGAERIELVKCLYDGGGYGREYGRLSGKTINPEKIEFIDSSCTGLYATSVKGLECLGEKL